MTPTKHQRIRRGFVWLAAGAATLGIGVGAAGLASAASNTGDTSTTSTVVVADTPAASTDAAPVDPASLPNGPGETVLTGDTLTKVTAAAEAAEPGATIIRAETDSSGHAYEVHVQLADGSYETLYFDESFAADGSDTGFGPGGPGGVGGPRGDHQPPAGATDSSTTTG